MTTSLLVKVYYFALLFFILCNMIKIMLFPCLRSRKMKNLMRAYEKTNRTREGIVDYYNANRDLTIFLDILATKYGLGHAMAAMALFDTVRSAVVGMRPAFCSLCGGALKKAFAEGCEGETDATLP